MSKICYNATTFKGEIVKDCVVKPLPAIPLKAPIVNKQKHATRIKEDTTDCIVKPLTTKGVTRPKIVKLAKPIKQKEQLRSKPSVGLGATRPKISKLAPKIVHIQVENDCKQKPPFAFNRASRPTLVKQIVTKNKVVQKKRTCAPRPINLKGASRPQVAKIGSYSNKVKKNNSKECPIKFTLASGATKKLIPLPKDISVKRSGCSKC
jgi:hypothetical protein